MQLGQRVTHLLRRFVCGEEGNVMILTALFCVVLVALSGMGIDLGRQQLVRIKLQQASDAAALAGALAATADQSTTALRYFNLNYPTTYMDVARPTPAISVGANVTVSANATVPTYFMKLLGQNTVAASGSSGVQTNQSKVQSYDMILVIDNSGSMYTTDVGSSSIRAVPNGTMTATLNAAIAQCEKEGWGTAYCTYGTTLMQEQSFGLVGNTRINAVRYSANYLANQLLVDSSANNRIGAVRWDATLINQIPLTSDLSTVTNYIDTLAAIGDTNSTLGLAAAQTMQGSFNAKSVHAVVLLTDGENNSTAYNTTSLAICTAMKAANTVIYTIAFGNDVNTDTTAKNFLSSCATTTTGSNLGTYFFIAPNAAALSAAFSSIVTSVQKLRIVQ